MEKCSPTTSPEGEGFDATGQLAEFLTDADDEILLSPELQELLEGVMRELYEEISPPEKEAKLSQTAASSPSESCGASVSDSASTMMAGVEFAGNPGAGAGSAGWCVVVEEEDGKSNDARELVDVEMDGCDGVGFWG